MLLEIQAMTWDKHKHMAGLNQLMWAHNPLPLINWISNCNICMNKQIKQTLHRFYYN